MLLLLHRCHILGGKLTVREVHNLLYFLQEAGEGLRLRFTRETCGLYAANLQQVLHMFEGHFTLGFGDGGNSPETTIRLLPDALHEAEQFLAACPRDGSEAAFERGAKLIEGIEPPCSLELLASVHWVSTHLDEQMPNLDSAIRAIHAWNDRTCRILNPEHIGIAWQWLRESGWIPPR